MADQDGCRISQDSLLKRFDQDLRPALGLRHFALPEDKFDGPRVVLWDQALVPEGVDQGLAATDSVVDVEELGPVAGDRKPITSACLASALSRVRIQWFRPSIVFKLGVTYPARTISRRPAGGGWNGLATFGSLRFIHRRMYGGGGSLRSR